MIRKRKKRSHHSSSIPTRESRIDEKPSAAQVPVDLERRRYQNLFELAPDGYVVTDRKGVIRLANQAAGVMLRVEPTFLVGKLLAAFVDKPNVDLVRQQIGAFTRKKGILNIELRLRPREADTFHAAISARAIGDIPGHLAGILWLIRNTDAEKQSEEALRQQRILNGQLLRAQNQVGDGIAITEDDRILFANAAMARICGYSVRGLLALPSLFALVAPEEHARAKELQRRRQGIATRPARGEVVIVRKDGHRVDIEYATHSAQVNGRRQSVTIARDISARKRAQGELARQTELYTSLLQAQSDLGEGVALTLGTRFVHVNAALARLYGYTIDELLALPSMLDLVVPEERERLAVSLRRRLSGEPSSDPNEVVVTRKDGRRINLEYSAKVVHVDGQAHLFSIIRDVTERKLAEARFQGVVEAAPDAMMLVDRQGKIRFVNSRTEEIFGYARDELEGQSVEMLIPTRFRGKHLDHRAAYSQNPQVRAMGAGLELAGLRKDGSEFPVDVSLSPLQTNEGTSIIASIRDISDRVRLEQALIRTREQGVIMQGISDGITVQDPTGHLIFANESAARFLGYASAQELLNTPVAQVTQKFHMMDEEGRPFPLERLPGRIALQGKPAGDVLVRFRILATGEERWSLVNASPVRDESGQVLFAVNIFHDMTERRRNAAGILRLAAAVESTEDAVIAKTVEGIIQNWNPSAARLYGYSADEAIGKSIEMVFPPERLDEFREIVERLRRGEPTPTHDSLRVRKDGTRVHVSVNVSPIKDGSGRILGATTVARDISARKRAEETQRFLAEASRVLASSLDYEETLGIAARLAVPGIADWSAIDILTEEEELKRVAVAHVNPEKIKWAYELQERYPPDPNAPTGIYNVLRTGKTEFTPEITQAMIAAANLTREQLKLLDQLQLTSIIIAPMIAHGKTLGAVTFVSAESGRRYGATDVAIAEELAARAALAIDNARLYHLTQLANEELETRVAQRTIELQQSNEQLRLLSAHLQSAREEERIRISREVHDELGQALAAIKIDLSLLSEKTADQKMGLDRDTLTREIEETTQLVGETIGKMRRILQELRPVILDDIGLGAAIESHIDEFQVRTRIQCMFHSGLDDARVDANRSTALFRILQETLSNVARHAGATRVEISLTEEKQVAILEIHDNGKGLGESDLAKRKSFGILGMRERAVAFGGWIDVKGSSGKGTTLTARIPL